MATLFRKLFVEEFARLLAVCNIVIMPPDEILLRVDVLGGLAGIVSNTRSAAAADPLFAFRILPCFPSCGALFISFLSISSD